VSGSSSDGAPTSSQALNIVTVTVPAGSEDASYGPHTLQAVNAKGPLTWELAGGALPEGVNLLEGGTLIGAPEDTGLYHFTVGVSDGSSYDTQQLALSVDSFGAYVANGLTHDDAWSGVPVSIATVGATGTVTFNVETNGSGGTLADVDMAAGTAEWRPGSVAVTGVRDVIRVTDVQSGQSYDLTLDVTPNPLANHVARFGTTDVWYVDFEQKHGTHAYASDWHAALVRLGLRNPASTSGVGTEADRLADMAARVYVLGALNEHYLRNQDGSDKAGSLAISFPYAQPESPFFRPSAGSAMSGNANAYSLMAVCDVAHYGQLGSAILDTDNNSAHESDMPGGAYGALGVFVNRIVDQVVSAFDDYGTELINSPVAIGDVPALKALLYERNVLGGGRAATIAYTLEGLAESMATVLAHEIGHSLGLPHTTPLTQGSLMNHSLVIHPGVEYGFLPHDIDSLRGGLPGPGRANLGVRSSKVGHSGADSRGLMICGQ